MSQAYYYWYVCDTGVYVTYLRNLWEIAATQHAVVTTRDAQEAAVPAVELRKLASRGALRHLAHGVYQHSQVPVTRYTQPAVAVAVVGAGAYLEWDAVLSLCDLALVNPAAIQVATPHRFRGKVPPYVRVSSPRSLRPAHELTHHEGIPGLTVHAALIEAAQRLPHDRVRTAADTALSRDLLSPTEHRALLQLFNRAETRAQELAST